MKFSRVDHNHLLQDQVTKQVVQGMATVEKLPERRLYKVMLLVLKVIPMLLALIAIIGMMLDFLGKDSSILSFIGGVSFLPLLFLYLASYVFRFCEYHRMFLHYVVANNLLTYADYYIGLPIENTTLFMLHVILVGIFLFLVLYFYRREKCCR